MTPPLQIFSAPPPVPMRESKRTGPAAQLPDEIIVKIFSYLPGKSSVWRSIRSVCKKWNAISYDTQLFKKLCVQRPLIVQENALRSYLDVYLTERELKIYKNWIIWHKNLEQINFLNSKTGQHTVLSGGKWEGSISSNKIVCNEIIKDTFLHPSRLIEPLNRFHAINSITPEDFNYLFLFNNCLNIADDGFISAHKNFEETKPAEFAITPPRGKNLLIFNGKKIQIKKKRHSGMLPIKKRCALALIKNYCLHIYSGERAGKSSISYLECYRAEDVPADQKRKYSTLLPKLASGLIQAGEESIYLAVEGGEILACDLETGNHLETLTINWGHLPKSQRNVDCLVLNKGILIAGFSTGDVYFWNAQNRELLHVIPGKKRIKSLSVTNDYLAINRGEGQKIEIWDRQSLQKQFSVKLPKEADAIALHSEQENFTLAAILNNNALLVWSSAGKRHS